MIKYDILHKITGEVKLTAEIDCDKDAPNSVKLGLAVKWGIKSKKDLSYANLSCADLRSADLHYADLSYADLSCANLHYADLSYADLSCAKNGVIPVIIGQVGNEIRTGYALWTPDGVQVALGCFAGTEKEAVKAVSNKYGARSGYVMMVKAACKVAKERGILNPTKEEDE